MNCNCVQHMEAEMKRLVLGAHKKIPGNLIELELLHPITCKFEQLPFNIFLIHVGFLTSHRLLNQRKLPPAVPLPFLLTILQDSASPHWNPHRNSSGQPT
jgi:hypothetical protein